MRDIVESDRCDSSFDFGSDRHLIITDNKKPHGGGFPIHEPRRSVAIICATLDGNSSNSAVPALAPIGELKV